MDLDLRPAGTTTTVSFRRKRGHAGLTNDDVVVKVVATEVAVLDRLEELLAVLAIVEHVGVLVEDLLSHRSSAPLR